MKTKVVLLIATALAVAVPVRAQEATCRAAANLARSAAKLRDGGSSAADAKAYAASGVGAVDPETRAAAEQAQGVVIDFAFAHPTLYPDDVAAAFYRVCLAAAR
jgi:hypothetical protein